MKNIKIHTETGERAASSDHTEEQAMCVDSRETTAE